MKITQEELEKIEKLYDEFHHWFEEPRIGQYHSPAAACQFMDWLRKGEMKKEEYEEKG